MTILMFLIKRARCYWDPACAFPEVWEGLCRQHLYDSRASFSFTMLYSGEHWMRANVKPFTIRELAEIARIDREVRRDIEVAKGQSGNREKIRVCLQTGMQTSLEISGALNIPIRIVSTYLSQLCARGEAEVIGTYRDQKIARVFHRYATSTQEVSG